MIEIIFIATAFLLMGLISGFTLGTAMAIK